MEEIRFEWDSSKDKSNQRKHRVDFEEAKSAFHDEHAIQFFDPEHSEDEDRFILLGISFKLNIVVICHCYRESQRVIRLISARRADKQEEQDYWRRR